MKIPYSIYNKKYKEAEKGLSSRQDEIFVERLEQLKDIYRELDRVAKSPIQNIGISEFAPDKPLRYR